MSEDGKVCEGDNRNGAIGLGTNSGAFPASAERVFECNTEHFQHSLQTINMKIKDPNPYQLISGQVACMYVTLCTLRTRSERKRAR